MPETIADGEEWLKAHRKWTSTSVYQGIALEVVKAKLVTSHLQFTGDLQQPVTQVGLCCGSGAELLGEALRAGCDLFLTGEARFHSLLEARTAGTAIVLAGHYATERPAMEGLAPGEWSCCVRSGSLSQRREYAGKPSRHRISVNARVA